MNVRYVRCRDGSSGVKANQTEAAEASGREGPGTAAQLLLHSAHTAHPVRREPGEGEGTDSVGDTSNAVARCHLSQATLHTLPHPVLPPCMCQALPQSTYSVTALSVHRHVCGGSPAMYHHGHVLQVFWPQVRKFLTGGLRVGS